ncbi:beta-methylgalactoside transporter inner membrane component [Paenibacillus konkukensis]|uniref:Beta-methylgalactoside transporter inner membrane component n=1 Tax=Paenibacillus konkukensis TaxID=2020716 RepID=A0ABY4RIX0_9BACL|nr:ABC transporter permease [Paenibacillus konkukensis]UQZ82371.1 beta-methylgalactoside transporter inner membrane component [Paenibacillus konkukensis]
MSKLIYWLFKESSLVSLIAIGIGLLLGSLIMLAGGYNPLLAYGSLFGKAFGDVYNTGETIRQITPFIFTGLSVAFAFRTGLFNIGAEGQFIMGALAADFVGISLHMPWYIHVPLAVVAGGLLGGLWGSIAGYLKAVRGVHEVITTIMLNWIALYLSNYLIKAWLLEPGQMRSKVVDKSAWLSSAGLSELFGGSRIHYGIVLALALAAVFYVVLWKTKQGFELRAVGLNPDASEYAGIQVNRNVIKAMFISGVFAGVGGVCEVLGVFHYQAVNTAFPGYGLMGIAVALIGRNSPVGAILGAVLIGVLTYGASGMKFGAGVPEELVSIMIALIIFFVAANQIVKQLLKLTAKNKKEVL